MGETQRQGMRLCMQAQVRSSAGIRADQEHIEHLATASHLVVHEVPVQHVELDPRHCIQVCLP